MQVEGAPNFAVAEERQQQSSSSVHRPVSAAEAELAAIQAQIHQCRRCAEAGYFVGAPVVSGQLRARVMLIGQAPSEAGATLQRPFAWYPGRPRPRIWDWLAQSGWSENEFRAQAYMTPVTKCYPGRARNGSGDRRPTATEVKLCAPYLESELILVDPALIVTVGTLALERLLGRVKLDDVVGRELDAEIAGRTRLVVPLPHPSGVSRWLNNEVNQAKLQQALATLRAIRERLNL